MKALEMLRRAERLMEGEPCAACDQVEELAGALAAVIFVTEENELATAAEALGATFAVIDFYTSDDADTMLKAFGRGLARGRASALAEEGLGQA